MKTSRPLTSLKRSFQAATVLLALAGATSASAVLLHTHEISGSPLRFLQEGNTTSYTNTFTIPAAALAGYNNISYTVDFAFADDDDSAQEWVDVKLGGITIWDDVEVDGDHPASNYEWLSQLGLGSKIYTSGTIFNDFQDGSLNFEVKLAKTSEYGTQDTYLKVAKLTVNGDRTPSTTSTVPDGGATLGLMGLGLMGLGALRRKLR